MTLPPASFGPYGHFHCSKVLLWGHGKPARGQGYRLSQHVYQCNINKQFRTSLGDRWLQNTSIYFGV